MHGSRHNWGRLRTQTAVSALQSAGEPLTAAEESLVQKSRRVREAIAADVIESAKLLPKLRQTTNARGFRERQSAVAELAGVAAKTFAWGADDQRPSIRISVLNLATIRSADTPAEPAAIDVESSPTTPTDPAA
jgi:hypothetical protein